MLQLYDTTLRDGAQREGISFSVEDKLRIARKLDEVGIHFIEGGFPGANPKDAQFYQRAQTLFLSRARLVAFGSTRRPRVRAEKDPNLQALVEAGTTVVAIVGKSWDLHVLEVLGTSLKENLAMISDSVRFLKAHGLTVFFDAEHFFDGFKANRRYALQTLRAAAREGVDCLVLCDTNGGSIPLEIFDIVRVVRKAVPVPLAIHTHNDSGLAVANTLAAVGAGVIQVQGTINGYGERCGNADLCSLIPTLQLKMGFPLLSPEQLARLAEVSYFVSDVANIPPDRHQPYVGASAFTHKAGLHASAIMRREETYQHIDPTLVGNRKRVLVSELGGKGSVHYLARELGHEVSDEQARAVVEHIKEAESRGLQYEGAEASFELLLLRRQREYRPPFELVDFFVVVEKKRRPPVESGGEEELLSEAMIKVKVGNEIMHTAAEGNGPVNALDAALRKALLRFYPSLDAVRLTDYKVRILDEAGGTGSRVRVLIESSDGQSQWRTVGSSTNLIEASWVALADSLEYWLLRRARESA